MPAQKKEMSEFEQQHHGHANLDPEILKSVKKMLQLSGTEKLEIDHEFMSDNRTKCKYGFLEILALEW